jgi:hypothetical protein
MARDLANRAHLELLFPDLAAHPESRFLALPPYLHHCPERFFSRTVYALMLDWLKLRVGGSTEAASFGVRPQESWKMEKIASAVCAPLENMSIPL